MYVQSGCSAIKMATKGGHSDVVKLLMNENKNMGANLISSAKNGDREELSCGGDGVSF